MYKLRLMGVKNNYWCIMIPWGGSSSRTGWWLGTWPFWSLLEFLRWVGFKRGWIMFGAINQCRDEDWRRPHSMRAPKQLCLKPVLQISHGFAMAFDKYFWELLSEVFLKLKETIISGISIKDLQTDKATTPSIDVSTTISKWVLLFGLLWTQNASVSGSRPSKKVSKSVLLYFRSTLNACQYSPPISTKG